MRRNFRLSLDKRDRTCYTDISPGFDKNIGWEQGTYPIGISECCRAVQNSRRSVSNPSRARQPQKRCAPSTQCRDRPSQRKGIRGVRRAGVIRFPTVEVVAVRMIASCNFSRGNFCFSPGRNLHARSLADTSAFENFRLIADALEHPWNFLTENVGTLRISHRIAMVMRDRSGGNRQSFARSREQAFRSNPRAPASGVPAARR